MEGCHYDVLIHAPEPLCAGRIALADNASTTNKLRHRAAGRPGAREAACVPALSTEQQP